MKDIYVFLDVDGVIATQRSLDLKWRDYLGADPHDTDFSEVLEEKNLDFPALSMDDWPFDQECISNFHYYQRIFRQKGHNIKYVISSSWRTGRTVEELEDLFRLKGLVLCQIVDKTGRDKQRKRGREILSLLKDNNVENEPFIVIDDECNDIKEFIDEKYIIDTTFNTGFDYSKMRRCIYKTNEQLSDEDKVS